MSFGALSFCRVLEINDAVADKTTIQIGRFDFGASLNAHATAQSSVTADIGGGICLDLQFGMGLEASANIALSFTWHITPPETGGIRVLGAKLWEPTGCYEQRKDKEAKDAAERKLHKKKFHWGMGKYLGKDFKTKWKYFKSKFDRAGQEKLRLMMMAGIMRRCTYEDVLAHHQDHYNLVMAELKTKIARTPSIDETKKAEQEKALETQKSQSETTAANDPALVANIGS